MTDHTWIHDHAAVAAAGGLNADEAIRFDEHIRDCPACAAVAAKARGLDRTLAGLFADVRPNPAFEDRAVHSLRADVRRKRAFAGWQRKLAYGLAASVGLGLVGVAANSLPRLPFPGEEDNVNGRINRESPSGGPVSVSALRNHELAREPANASDYGEVAQGKDLGNQGVELEANLKSTKGLFDEKPHRFNLQVDPKDGERNVTGKPGAANNYYGYFVPNGETAFGFGGRVAEPSNGVTVNGRVEGRPAWAEKDHKALGTADAITGFRQPLEKAPRPEGSPNFYSPNPNQAPPVAADPPAAIRKIVIRSGDIEFEVDSFDAAVATVTQLVGKIKNGYIATVNSDKLPNGKVKGSIVARVPPESLDPLVLDLRKELGKAGELKGQRIGSQDITKQYTDLESRLKAARTMEERLLKIIAEGKGEIKQLLEAEKELGVWRTKIEEFEGELRYYGNLVSLSTLTITLAEKEIRAAAGLIESERVDAGIEVEDVDAAYRDVLKAVSDTKGRVTKAELKQHTAGQFNATVHFEVSPEAAGPMRDRLRQLGRVARLQIDRVQTADGPVTKDAKVKHGDTMFLLQLYNLANIEPREAVTQHLAAADVAASYRNLQEAVSKVKGRVLVANLNESDRQNVSAQFSFEIRRADEGVILAALAAAGEVVSRTVTRAVESDKYTDSKIVFHTTLSSVARLKPREIDTLSVEVADVDAAASTLAAQALEAKGRQLENRVMRDIAGKVTAKLTYAVPLAAASGLVEKFKAAGQVRGQDSQRDPQAADGPVATARVELTLTSVDPLVAGDDGLWPQIRKGLSTSATFLLKSVTYLIFGVCVVLPWALVGYGGYRLIRRLMGRRSAVPTN